MQFPRLIRKQTSEQQNGDILTVVEIREYENGVTEEVTFTVEPVNDSAIH
jgi:hypothetical protein